MRSAFPIADRWLGHGHGCFVVALAGTGHQGDLQLGYKLIETAGAAGADAIELGRAGDQLSERDFKSLLGYARHVGLTAFSTPRDPGMLELLASLDVPAFRIELDGPTAWGLLEKAAGVGRPAILSTGTCGREEVEEALEICRRAGNEEVVLLAEARAVPAEGVDFARVDALLSAFPHVPAGVTVRSGGIRVCRAAMARGACLIERPFALAKDPWALGGSCMDPDEMKALVVELQKGQAAAGVARGSREEARRP